MAHVLIARAAALTLSDDAGIECIITGIPLLCIGVMSLGVFTFVSALKRTDVLFSLLFVSCFLSFVGAIIDLGQILIRGYANINNGLQLGQVAGLLRAREVFLSLSVGCLFVFYWLFASHRPKSVAISNADGMDMEKSDMATRTTMSAGNVHCASWERWGYVGIAMKWVSLVVCFLIVTLQLVWRLTRKHRLYGDLYVASATLETTISIVFILKLLLNFYLAPSKSKRQVLLGYIAPIGAFVISAGIGIGNLVVFAFSESSLGRFLRGVELYVLLIYSLVSIFSTPSPSLKDIPLPYQGLGIEAYLKQGKEDLVNSVGQPPVPYTGVPHTAAANPTTEAVWQIRRVSQISRISSWIDSRRNSRKSMGEKPPTHSLLFLPTASAAAGAAEGSVASSVLPAEPRPESNSSMNFFSYYGLDRTGKSTAAFRDDTSTIASTGSPLYGLNGIILPSKKTKPSKLSKSATTDGGSGDITPVRMTRLMEQQAAIDKSIAALREEVTRDTKEGAKEGTLTVERLKAANLTPEPADSALGSSKPSSPTNASEFSLSVFPEPPPPALVSPTSLREMSSRQKIAGRSISKRAPPVGVIPIQLDSSARDSDRYESPLSAGTRYDVTSFIGGFAVPQQSAFPSSNSLVPSSEALPSSSSDVNMIPNSGMPVERPNPGRLSPTATGKATSQYVILSRTASGRPLGSATMSSSPDKFSSTSGPDVPSQNLALRTLLTRNETNQSRLGGYSAGSF